MIFSIVTPSYQQGKFIAKTLESIFSQAGEFWIDLIVQDGGSIDGTRQILEAWDQRWQSGAVVTEKAGLTFRKGPDVGCWGLSFRWVSQKDGGQSAAINEGFAKAVGSWGGWLNSDDWFESGALARAQERLKVESQRPFFGAAHRWDHENRPMSDVGFDKRRFTVFDALYRLSPPQPSVFFPIALYRQVGGLRADYHYELDKDLWLRMLDVVQFFDYDDFVYSSQLYHLESKSMSGERPFALFEAEHQAILGSRKQALGWKRPLYEARAMVARLGDALKARLGQK